MESKNKANDVLVTHETPHMGLYLRAVFNAEACFRTWV